MIVPYDNCGPFYNLKTQANIENYIINFYLK